MLRDFAAIDFETANDYPSSICSVGIVIVRNGKVTDTIYELIQPEPNFYCPGNSAVNGFCFEDTDKAPVFPSVWKNIAPQIEGLPLVAHNSSFDEGCLRAAHKTYMMDYPDYRFYCTYRAARKQFPRLSSYRLDAVAAHCGYELQNHHHALADAEACAAIAQLIL